MADIGQSDDYSSSLAVVVSKATEVGSLYPSIEELQLASI